MQPQSMSVEYQGTAENRVGRRLTVKASFTIVKETFLLLEGEHWVSTNVQQYSPATCALLNSTFSKFSGL